MFRGLLRGGQTEAAPYTRGGGLLFEATVALLISVCYVVIGVLAYTFILKYKYKEHVI